MISVSNIKKYFLDALFPVHCLGDCGKEGEWVCNGCASNLLVAPHGLCAGCGKSSSGGFTHEDCGRRTALSALFAPFPYANPLVRSIVKHYKYHGIESVEPMLHRMVINGADSMRTLFPKTAIVVPVPLSKSRLRERGFNQAERIALALGKALELPVLKPVERIRNTDHQADLPIKERLVNCKDAFESTPVSGNVILVDDVVTTGATMESAARALRTAGATNIIGFALAHG